MGTTVKEPPVTRLYPDHAEAQLRGLYLQHRLRDATNRTQPFLYTNFISSLDGHISEVHGDTGRRRVPAALANPRDWRLYMELLAQSDAVLTTARHLRAIAAGRQRELVSLQEDPQFSDLAAWRADHGLAPYPVTAVLSNRLDFPLNVTERLPGGLVILCGAGADAQRIASVRSAGIEVIQAETDMDGARILQTMQSRNLQAVYSIAGPAVMQTLLNSRVLDRIYLSLAPLLLSGEPFDTLTRGPALEPPAGFRLHELYLDTQAPAPGGQLLMSFDRAD